jgi:long-chain fatty acid transport protein
MIFEHGASGTGMADARTALANDVNALFYNPAAISELPGLQFQLGATGILPSIHYEAAGGPSTRTYWTYENSTAIEQPVNDGQNSTDAKLVGFTPLHLYTSYNFSDIGISVGYALNNPYGLGTFWKDDWDGRFIGTETELRTFCNQPVVSVDIAQLAGIKDSLKLSVALGYTFVYATALLAKKVDLRIADSMSQGNITGAEGLMSMTGDAVGHGFNAAIYAEIPDLLSFGASYRSKISLPFSGTAKFFYDSNARAALNMLLITIPDETTGSVELNMPEHINIGVAFHGIKKLIIAVDSYITFFESYDQLSLKFSCVDEGTCSDITPEPIEKNWHTSWQVSLGLDYQLLSSLSIRSGYGYVTSPVPAETYDPSLPDGDRNFATLGFGYRSSWWKVDLGYMFTWWSGVKDNDVGIGDGMNPEGMANGTYSTKVHLLALSMSCWFD